MKSEHITFLLLYWKIELKGGIKFLDMSGLSGLSGKSQNGQEIRK